jgi:hypothetical protein
MRQRRDRKITGQRRVGKGARERGVEPIDPLSGTPCGEASERTGFVVEDAHCRGPETVRPPGLRDDDACFRGWKEHIARPFVCVRRAGLVDGAPVL